MRSEGCTLYSQAKTYSSLAPRSRLRICFPPPDSRAFPATTGAGPPPAAATPFPRPGQAARPPARPLAQLLCPRAGQLSPMGSPDESVEVDALERHLLAGLSSNDYDGNGDNEVLYDASFREMEDGFVKYQIAHWILLSILLILAWGMGILMLLYLPIRMYVCRRGFRSRKLYLTPHAVVYKVNKPVAFPWFGVSKNEKYVILPAISGVVIEQGYIQSFFGVYSIRIESIGVRRPPSDDVKITGVAHLHDFKKAVLVHLMNTRNLNFGTKASVSNDQQSTSLAPIRGASSWRFDSREAS